MEILEFGAVIDILPNLSNTLKKNIMKKLIFCIFISIISICANAQIELATLFNDSHTGINQSLIISKRLGDNYEIGGGLKYNINRYAHPDDQRKVFYKRLYASSPLHFWGGELFINRYLFEKKDNLHPFVFYNVRLSYSATHNIGFVPYTYSENGDVLYLRYDTNYGPFTWLEQYVGFGYKIDFAGSL